MLETKYVQLGVIHDFLAQNRQNKQSYYKRSSQISTLNVAHAKLKDGRVAAVPKYDQVTHTNSSRPFNNKRLECLVLQRTFT